MWDFVENTLSSFRKCFSRTASYEWFCTVVIGFMIRSDKLGVTSVVRDLNLHHSCYEKIVHFFHSGSCSLPSLCDHWYSLVGSLSVAHTHNGRNVFIIDGVKQSKEGRYMPGVKKMSNDSDTQSKPQTMHGHMAGMLSLLVGSAEKMAALPLKMTIQDGVKGMSHWEGSGVSGESHIVQMFRMASDAAGKFKREAVVLADRLFLTNSALREVRHHNENSAYAMHLVTKCKKNAVAYGRPGKHTGRGRPRKRGTAVHLNDYFSHPDIFLTRRMKLYDRMKDVRYFCINLLWGHTEPCELRFVLVMYDDVKSILVTTDLAMAPEDVISLYACRFRIEHLFRSLKQFYGGFSYHFWTKAMPRLNRFRKSDDPDPLASVTSEKDRERIISALRATEMYMFISNVAIGITMMISIIFDIDPQELRYQRTPAKKKPSEDNIMYYLRKQFPVFLTSETDIGINRIIIKRQVRL